MSKKLSLQEQLLKSGLASTAQARAVKSEKNKQTQMQRKNNVAVADDAKEAARLAKLEQQAKDQALNQQRLQQEQQKQLLAQVKQLIEQNTLSKTDGDEAYHFTDDNKVKTVYVDKATRDKLSAGKWAIVKHESQYHIVSAETAEKIKERQAEAVLVLNTIQHNTDDDPYAAYQVPDDLMW